MKSVGSWSLEESSTLGRLGFEGLFSTLYYSLVDHFGLEGSEEVSTLSSSGFLFNNISQYYFEFVILFPITFYIFALYLYVHSCNC